MQSLLYERKVNDCFFQELLVSKYVDEAGAKHLVVACCVHGDEPSGSVNDGEWFCRLSDCQLLGLAVGTQMGLRQWRCTHRRRKLQKAVD
jgi:hypothetical protein